MRIHRIRLQGFRGIVDREVCFDATGVTVVEGPNEVGKSSIVEALDLLLEQPDSSKKKAVNEVKPVNRDVGPEVEADLETGPYLFSYRTRSVKKPETLLEVKRPRPEQLTGRDAHDRVREILDETMDVDLWKALRVVQGSRVEPADLSHASALSRALDRVAGQEVTSERETTLLEAAKEARLFYYTEQGHPKKLLVEAEGAVGEARAEVERLERELADLEELVGRKDGLDRDVLALASVQDETRRAAQAREKELETIARQASVVERLRLDLEMRGQSVDAASRDFEARMALVRKLEEAEAEVVSRREAVSAGEPALADAMAEQGTLAAQAEAARLEAERTAAIFDLRRRDKDHLHDLLDLDTLRERRARIEAAVRARAEAELVVERTRVTDDLLGAIKVQVIELEKARALLQAGSPRLHVKALAGVLVEIGGESLPLKAGQFLERAVESSLAVRVPDVLEVEVAAGTSLDDLRAGRDAAQDALAALLAEAGVADLAHAERDSLARRDALRVIGESGLAIDTDLRDLTVEQMDGKVERLCRKVAKYPSDRPVDPAVATTFDEAGALLSEAEGLASGARLAHELVAERLVAASSKVQVLKDAAAQANVDLQVAVGLAFTARLELETARAKISDDVLATGLAQARGRAGEARIAYEEARQALDTMDPDRVRELAANARKAADRAARELREAQDERLQLDSKLETLGGKGLHEDLESARTALSRAERRGVALQRKAMAADLLYRTLVTARDASRRAYADPLRKSIAALGRYVFDGTFDVELSEDLSVASRTMAGVTLAHDCLSVGAREQLGLVVRIAAAMLVDPGDGVPVVLDDTMGHTDPARLEGVGAVLARAGTRCQVIVLTCTPGRFAHVGDAKVVRL